ncbi:MAG: cadmium-translocating P-type ATPase [Calditrichia bacterium]|nr:cadmium-translocating P-type ATPase [Calditrichia bacterium]
MKEQLLEKDYTIDGMDCADCARYLEDVVLKVKGIKSADINFITAKMCVASDEKLISDQLINKAVKTAGYKIISDQSGIKSSVQNFLPNSRLSVVLSGLFIFTGALLHAFTSSELSAVISVITGIIIGGTPIAQKGIMEARNFKPGMNVLMTVAVIGAMVIGEWMEAGTVVFLFALAQLLEAKSMDKARRSINTLIDKSPKTARVLRNGNFENLPVTQVVVGDYVAIKPGEYIPMDGIVMKGKSHVDQSTITGESFPARKKKDDRVYAGTLNKNGYLEVKVDRTFDQSTFSKIIHLVMEAQAKKAPKQAFIDRFAQYYTPIVILLAVIIAIIPPLIINQPFEVWFYRALVILVIACPCALVISTPVTIVSGLTAAIRKGILIKGGRFLENFTKLDAIAFDKTGTLTEGKPVVRKIISEGNFQEEEILNLAASLESKSEHPIAEAIVKYANERHCTLREVDNFKAIEGKGIEGDISGEKYIAGNHKLFEERGWCDEKVHATLDKIEDERHTAILIGNSKGIIGIISISDSLRDSGKDIIETLRKSDIKEIVLLTGDNHRTAEKIARAIGINSYYAELLPKDKVVVIEGLKENYNQVAMVGDGVNDAPSLASADIGIAMGTGGSDAALDTADIVLVKDDLRGLSYLKYLSKLTLRIIKQNIFIALGLKILFLALAISGLATLWMAVFADMGASLLVIFNGLRTLK